MISLKKDLAEALVKRGLTSTIFKKSGMIGQSTLTRIRKQDANVTLTELNKLCVLLDCQPADLLEYVETPEDVEAAAFTKELAMAKLAEKEALKQSK